MGMNTPLSKVDRNIYCEILKKEIKKKCSSRKKFATEYLGISYEALKDYVNPYLQKWPPLPVWVDLCNIFDCDPEYLLGLQALPRRETVDICSVTGLSPTAIEALRIRRCGLDSGFESPDTLELKTLNFILEHGIGMDDNDDKDKTIYMKETLLSYIGYILFSRFVDARTNDAVAKKIHSSDNKYHVSYPEKDKITFYDEVSGTYTEFRIEDLNLSQMENIRKSIYLLKDEIDKQNRPTK